MKEEKICVLALLPTEYAKTVTIDNTLEAMQQFVGGLIECIPMDDPDADISRHLSDLRLISLYRLSENMRPTQFIKVGLS